MKATQQYSQQSISRDRKMKEMKQEGEMKVSEVKQQLKEEQSKLQQKEEEIDELKRCVCMSIPVTCSSVNLISETRLPV